MAAAGGIIGVRNGRRHRREVSGTVASGDRTIIAERYEARLAEAGRQLAQLRPVRRRIAWFRLVAFLAAAGAFFAHAWVASFGFVLASSIGGIALASFVVLIVWQRRVGRRIDHWEKSEAACRQGVARIDRHWAELGETPEPAVDDTSGLSDDLDILGKASLYRLTGGAYTAGGQQTLARWLLSPAEAEEIVDRQALVAELRDRTDLLLEMRILTQGLDEDSPDPGPFLAWAEGGPWLTANPKILWSARCLSVLPALAVVAVVLGWVEPAFLILALLINLLFSRIFSPKALGIFDLVEARMGRVALYAKLFRFISDLELTSPRGRSIQARLREEGSTADADVRKLTRILSFADLRRMTMLHFPVQVLTLFDFHLLAVLESWQVRVGPQVGQWLDALGEFEAFIGLATLAHDNPGYTFPDVNGSGPPHFSAQALGHPLLPPSTCVTNDVDLGTPGTFLLVTGSNMSGKSSLLRSIGLNTALACSGGPVFADALVLNPFVLGTRFRVVDSISEGVSFFMAELRRLKQIVTWAEERTLGGPPLLFLLDEILQGTNIIERRVAVSAILQRLIRLGCLGAVSSHDLTLADADGLVGHAVPVYFTERFREGAQGREMYFDYTLRPGLAPTTNALELLRMVGLE